MDGFLLGLASAFWLGILTSISPCPMATNVAAISYIGSNVKDNRRVMLSGLLYALGRIITYTVLGLPAFFRRRASPSFCSKT